ncbi:hypothetical protein AT6N2_C2371 [Agrobacterium tumefaciens]|nr:hypothetical protein AT6N2_C2371 [Agrobacterium tumefaciens]
MRHQRHFTKAPRAFVSVEYLVQYGFALRSLGFDDAASFELYLDIVDQRTLMRKGFRAGNITIHAQRVRRREDLFSGNIRVAGYAVFGDRSAAVPFMPVRKPDRDIRARTGETQCRKTLAIEPRRPLGKIGVMLRPGGNRIGHIHARCGENGIREPADSVVFRHIGEDLLCPGRVWIRDDVPVDVEVGNLLQRRLVGGGIGLVGARHLGWILFGQQHRVVAGNRQPRCAIGIGFCHAFIEPAGSPVKIGVARVAIAGKRGFFIGIEGGDQPATGHIGVFGQKTHQRQGCQRRGDHQILILLQLQADLDGDFGQFFEFDGIDGRNSHDLPSSISFGGADHSPFQLKAKCFQRCLSRFNRRPAARRSRSMPSARRAGKAAVASRAAHHSCRRNHGPWQWIRWLSAPASSARKG